MAEFNADANKRIAKTVQRIERKHQNPRTRRARWFRSSTRVRFAWATVMQGSGYTDVATTDATFEVTDIIPFDGLTWTGDDPLTVKNDPDEYEITAGDTGKIVYCYDPDEEWAWHPLDFPCP